MKQLLVKLLPIGTIRKIAYIKSLLEKSIASVLSIIFRFLLNNKILMELSNKLEVKTRLDYKNPLFIHINSIFEVGMRANSCAKEPETIAWLEKYISADTVLYDIGANVGTYSLVASSIEKNIKIFAFEPSYSNYNQLCRNIVLNNVADKISPIMCAVSKNSGIETFNYWSVKTGAAISTLGDAITSKGEMFTPELSIPVLKYSLDEIVNILKIPQPNMIKVDVDGVEKDILDGGNNVLSNNDLKTVLIEINIKDDLEEIMNVFTNKHGFTLKEKHLIEGHAGNYIFVREQSIKKVK